MIKPPKNFSEEEIDKWMKSDEPPITKENINLLMSSIRRQVETEFNIPHKEFQLNRKHGKK